MYLMRAFGGLLYLSGALIMTYNIWMTIAGYQRAEAPMDDTAHDEAADRPIVAGGASGGRGAQPEPAE
jgi:cytochrome c oxidase cbb3-type subunit 1